MVELERLENLQGNLRQLTEFYLDYLRKNKSVKHVRNVEKALAKDLWIVDPEMKANKVTKSEILTILHPIVERGSLTMANRMRSYLMSMFKYGLDFDNSVEGISRGVQFFIEYNPVSSIVKPQKKEHVGDRVLSPKEVKQFWEIIEQSKMALPRINVFKLMLILGSRVEAIAGMRWRELDWDQQLFYLLRERSKNEKEHIIPLPELALQILKATPKLHPIYVFPAQNGQESLQIDGFSRAISRLCQSTGIEKFTPRDLRRTFKTLAGKAGLSKDIRDRLQYHSLSDVSSKHYDKYDYLPEKRKAMEVWNDYLAQVITQSLS